MTEEEYQRLRAITIELQVNNEDKLQKKGLDYLAKEIEFYRSKTEIWCEMVSKNSLLTLNSLFEKALKMPEGEILTIATVSQQLKFLKL